MSYEEESLMAYQIKRFWHFVASVAAGMLLVLLFVLLVSEKKIDGYYISQNGTVSGGPTATCVYAHWTWHLDERSFCTNSYQDAVDFVIKANATVKR
jgi:hypothetical protein